MTESPKNAPDQVALRSNRSGADVKEAGNVADGNGVGGGYRHQ